MSYPEDTPLADLAVEALHGFKSDRLPIFEWIAQRSDASEEVRAVARQGLLDCDTVESRSKTCLRLIELLDPEYALVLARNDALGGQS